MTPRQRNFAANYAKNQNVYQSAKEAGYSDTYCRSKAKVLLNHAEISAEIKRIRDRLNQSADKSAVDVVNELSKIAFTDRLGFLKEDPLRDGEFMFKSPDELTQDQRQCIENVKTYDHEVVFMVGEETRKEWRQEYVYVFSDKAKALENMGRHFGIFDDKLRLGVSKSNPFSSVTPEQLEKLKAAWIKTMNVPVIEGSYKEVNNK